MDLMSFTYEMAVEFMKRDLMLNFCGCPSVSLFLILMHELTLGIVLNVVQCPCCIGACIYDICGQD